LAGPPVAQMKRAIPISGLSDWNKMKLQSIQTISAKTQIFQLNLVLKDKRELRYKGI
jgi:hypothetical protein